MTSESKIIKSILDVRKTFQRVMRQEYNELEQGNSFEFEIYPQDWKVTWEKGVRAVEIAEEIKDKGYFTTSIELCFYSIERFFEAWIMKSKGIRGFRAKHGEVFDLASKHRLITERLAAELGTLWSAYRADQYYRPYVPSKKAAEQMLKASKEVANFVKGRL